RPVIPRPTSRANTSLNERRRGGMCFPPLLAGVDPYEEAAPPPGAAGEGHRPIRFLPAPPSLRGRTILSTDDQNRRWSTFASPRELSPHATITPGELPSASAVTAM